MRHLDKLLHLTTSFMLAMMASFFIGVGWGVTIAVLIGVAKEVWWDGYLGRGTPDWWDMVANCVGVMAAVVIMRGWGV